MPTKHIKKTFQQQNRRQRALERFSLKPNRVDDTPYMERKNRELSSLVVSLGLERAAHIIGIGQATRALAKA